MSIINSQDKFHSTNQLQYCFVSRDLRTHSLFRNSWHSAAKQYSVLVSVITRGFGLGNILVSLRAFRECKTKRRIIFGTSEICLYCLLSCKNDVWVFTGVGRLLAGRKWFSGIIKLGLRCCYQGQLVITLNETDRNELKEIFKSPPQIIEGEGYEFRARSFDVALPKHQDQIRFAYVGRILRSKGVDLLIREFSRNSKYNWTLTLVGDNDFGNRDSLSKEEIDRLASNSKGKIVITGFRNDVREILAEQDIYVSMSEREGLPFSVLDAIDAGLFLILSPVPGHLSFQGLPGVAFAAGDLSGIFGQFFTDCETRLKFDRKLRLEICEKRFGQNAIIARIGELVFSEIKVK
jgi:glycosyltransferase involved in cell wall biosynthesis